MIKKIALAAIFAVVSVVSFNVSSTVNAAKAADTVAPTVRGPVMQGLKCGFGC